MPKNRDAFPAVDTMAALMPRLSLSAYLAATLTQAEELLVSREVAVLSGDEALAREHEERAAGLLCVALGRASDEFRPPPELHVTPAHTDFIRRQLPTPPGVDLSWETFRHHEIELLHLVGLSRGLAVAHVDAALDAVAGTTEDVPVPREPGIRSIDDVKHAVEAAAGATCAHHRRLVERRRSESDGRRRRQAMRRCVLAAGGVLIVVANASALPFLPVVAVASAALGGGAAGAVANLIET